MFVAPKSSYNLPRLGELGNTMGMETTSTTPEITCRKAIAPGVPRRELWVEVLVDGKYHSSHPTVVDAHDRMRDIKATYEQHRQHDQKEAK